MYKTTINKTYSLVFGLMSLFVLSCGGATQEKQQQAQVHPDAQNQLAASSASPAGAGHPTAQTTAPNHNAGGPATSIPDFKFYILKSGIAFDNTDLKPAKTHVFVLFDPSCGHCKDEARDIGKNFASFKNTEFYFVSMNDPALMSTFFKNYAPELENKENVHLLFDKDMQFVYKFHIPTQYPATYIYRPDGSLKGFWNGEKKPEEIIQSINL